MLGPPKARRLAEPLAVSPEALVPPDNVSRHLDAKLDLRFVRDWVQERSADGGRPSVDPVVCCKLHLVMFFDGIRSARQLVETASLHLAHRWYLGSARNESLPDHARLTRIRQRLGLPVFARFFAQIVDRCQEGGLVWGKARFCDATKIRANADRAALVPRFADRAKSQVAHLSGADGSGEDPGDLGD